MKKIILPVLLLAGFITNAQSPITGSKLTLTNSPGTQTFANNNARIIASTVLTAGTLVDANTGGRLFSFMDMPQSNMD